MTETPTLEVAGEPGVFWCARHKSVKTRLRCGRCETPICPKCTVMGPTGARCRDCASNRSSHIYQVSPGHLLLTFAASLALGFIGAILVRSVGLMLLFFAPVVGTFLGKAIVTVTKGKRGPRLAAVASAGTILGALLTLGRLLPLLLAGSFGPGLLWPVGSVLVFLVLAVPSLWWWIK